MEFLMLIAFYFIMGLLVSLAYYIRKCKQFTEEAKMNKYLRWNKFSEREDISLSCVVIFIFWFVLIPSSLLWDVGEIVAKSIRKYFNIED